MKKTGRIAVCSRSFSAHPVLRQELLEQFPDVTFNDSGKTLSGEELVAFLAGHEKAIVALEAIDHSTLKKLPELRVIGKYGVGLDKLDFAAMDEFQVMMGWTPGVNARAVAELTLGIALNIVRNIQASHDLVKNQGWKQITGKQISSLTFGILGCGHVGKTLIKLLQPFGCKILVHDILEFKDFYGENHVQAVAFDELLKNADILSIHIPKNEKTTGLLGRENLLKLKKGAYLINTARGDLVNEAFILEMLNSGHITAVGFDVFAEEPPKTFDFIKHPKVFATGHIGGSSEEAILAMGRAAILGLTQYKKASEYEK